MEKQVIQLDENTYVNYYCGDNPLEGRFGCSLFDADGNPIRM